MLFGLARQVLGQGFANRRLALIACHCCGLRPLLIKPALTLPLVDVQLFKLKRQLINLGGELLGLLAKEHAPELGYKSSSTLLGS